MKDRVNIFAIEGQIEKAKFLKYGNCFETKWNGFKQFSKIKDSTQ